MCDAAIFDMDGLMIDSEPLWHQAEMMAFERRTPMRLTLADCVETTGLRIDQVVEHNFQKFGTWDESKPESTREAVTQAIVDEMESLLRNTANPMPGLKSALDFLGGCGVRLAVASSSPSRLIKAGLFRLGLSEGVFEVVCSAENEPYGKPHPGVYLSACSALGCDPTRCLALEDSLNGVIAAKAARLKCVAVPSVEDRPRPAFAVADVCLEHLGQLNGETWVALGFAFPEGQNR